jgi:uncharacterized protein (TIGR03000 family)
MSRILVVLRLGLLAAALFLAVPWLRGDDSGAEKSPLSLQVRLPADAALEIDGYRTRSTGEVRLYQSPPVAKGWVYRYTLRATRGGKVVERVITVRPEEPLRLDLRPDFRAQAPDSQQKPSGEAFARPGFVTFERDGRLWVFREKSKELEEFKRDGEIAKQVTRIGAGPGGRTIKAPDAETLDAYLKAPSR